MGRNAKGGSHAYKNSTAWLVGMEEPFLRRQTSPETLRTDGFSAL